MMTTHQEDTEYSGLPMEGYSPPHSIVLQDDKDNDQDMPMLTLEPPTPLQFDSNLSFNQGDTTRPLSIHGNGNGNDNVADSPSLYTVNNIFAWQESFGTSPSSTSRPASVSDWSVFGTSSSGEEASAIHPMFEDAPLKASSGIIRSKKKKSDDGSEKTKSHARKKAPGHVSRPRNAFILFRSHAIKHDLIPTSLGVKDNRAVSCIVASLWNSLPIDEKTQWKLEAEKEREWHRTQYPNYQFKPETGHSSKAKSRKTTNADDKIKEKCEVIADQILRSHGRSINNKEAMKKGEKGRRAATSSSPKPVKKNKDGLPKARISTKTQQVSETHDTVPFNQTITRRRSSSSIPFDSTQSMEEEEDQEEEKEDTISVVLEPTFDHFASWQTRLEQASMDMKTKETSSSPQLFLDQRDPPFNSFSKTKSGLKPAPLDFLLSTHNHMAYQGGDTTTFSPRTTIATSLLSSNAPSSTPRALYDRPKSATPLASPRHAVFQSGPDAMLLSPLQSTFGEMKRGSVGWQSWSRYSFADVALPVLRPRHTMDLTNVVAADLDLHHVQLEDEEDCDLFSHAARAANVSLHSLVSPTLQTYDDRSRGREEKERVEEDDIFQYSHAFSKQSSSGTTTPPSSKDYQSLLQSIKGEEDEEEEVDQLASDQEEEDQEQEMLDEERIVSWDQTEIGNVGETNLNFNHLAL